MKNHFIYKFLYATAIAVLPFILLIAQSLPLLVLTALTNIYILVLFYNFIFKPDANKVGLINKIGFAALVLFNIYTWIFLLGSLTF